LFRNIVVGHVSPSDDLFYGSGVDLTQLSNIVRTFGLVVAWSRWREDEIVSNNSIYFFLDERETRKVGLDETRRLVEEAGYSVLEKRDGATSCMWFDFVKSGARRIVIYHGSKFWLESNAPGLFVARRFRNRRWDGYQLVYRDSNRVETYEYVSEAVC
jgi:hypothetical protein